MKKILSFITAVITSVGLMIPVEVQAADTDWVGSPEMDSYMSDMIAAEKAPGMSMVIVDGDDVTFHSYGYDNIKDGVAADEYTIYELGSTTKAFTALAVLILDDEGVIDLDADIRTYIPWLELIHEGNPAVITCNQLLSHTAGIPEKYYADAIEGVDRDIMRQTAELINGKELDFAPGDQCFYSNLGYDLLGYIIELQSGTTYEDFVTERILRPLGMIHSGFHLETAQGYKLCYTNLIEYDAPRYQGSLPDGYLETCAADMALWLKAQMGIGENVPEQLQRLIQKSHSNIDPVCFFEKIDEQSLYYSYGWEVTDDGSFITHSGGQPNFVSDIRIFPVENRAICVMSNSSNSTPLYVTQGVSDAWNGKTPGREMWGIDLLVDKIASAVTIVIAVFMLLLVIGLLTRKKRISNKPHARLWENIRLVLSIIGSLLLFSVDIAAMVLMKYSLDAAISNLWVWCPVSLLILFLELPVFAVLLLVASVRRRLLSE